MKVLVTGANGFVGAHLCRHLAEQGAMVRALVRNPTNANHLNGQSIDVVKGDILDLQSLERVTQDCEQVYHLAAIVKFFTRNPKEMRAANTQGTRNVLTASNKAGVRRIVHTSTAAVLRRGPKGLPADETMLKGDGEAVGVYELSKLDADRAAVSAAKEGVPVVIVNLAAPVGPGDAKPSPIGQTILQFLKGKFPAYTDSGLNVVDVRDAAMGHCLVAEKGKLGERYVIGGENISLKRFLDLLGELSGIPSPKVRVPYHLTLIGGIMGEITGRLTGKEPLACLASVRMVGPGDAKPSPIGQTILQFLKGKFPAYTDSGLNVVDVRDAAMGHCLVAEKGKLGERYVIGGENISLKRFLDLLGELSGIPSPKVRVPYHLTLIGGIMGEITGRFTGKEPLACLASVRMAKYPHFVNIDKAKRELGYRPGPIRESLAEEISWFQNQNMV